MLANPTRTVAVLPSANDLETTCHRQTAPPLARSSRAIDGLFALSEQPGGVMAVTTLSALLSRISRSTEVRFGPYLQDLCADLDGTFGDRMGHS